MAQFEFVATAELGRTNGFGRFGNGGIIAGPGATGGRNGATFTSSRHDWRSAGVINFHRSAFFKNA